MTKRIFWSVLGVRLSLSAIAVDMTVLVQPVSGVALTFTTCDFMSDSHMTKVGVARPALMALTTTTSGWLPSESSPISVATLAYCVCCSLFCFEPCLDCLLGDLFPCLLQTDATCPVPEHLVHFRVVGSFLQSLAECPLIPHLKQV